MGGVTEAINIIDTDGIRLPLVSINNNIISSFCVSSCGSYTCRRY